MHNDMKVRQRLFSFLHLPQIGKKKIIDGSTMLKPEIIF